MLYAICLEILKCRDGSIICQIRYPNKDEMPHGESDDLMIPIILSLQGMENCYTKQIQDIVCARLLLGCSAVRESELSHLLARYVQNAHSLSLMHESIRKQSCRMLIMKCDVLMEYETHKCDVF